MALRRLQYHREGLVAILPVVDKSASIRDAFAAMRRHQHHALVRRDESGFVFITARTLSRDENRSAKVLGDVIAGELLRPVPAKDLSRVHEEARLEDNESVEGKEIRSLPGNLASGGISKHAITVFAKSAKHATWITTHYSFCLSCDRLIKTGIRCCDNPKQVQS